jgi:hypothetical protein
MALQVALLAVLVVFLFPSVRRRLQTVGLVILGALVLFMLVVTLTAGW